MADKYEPEVRSRIMSKVRSKDTKPEKLVRSLLHKSGFRFRLHRKDLPGSPDIVLPGRQKVIFVHGCFWHGHDGCSRSSRPSSNVDYWDKKLDRNIERDRENKKELRKLGWKPLVIWECETKRYKHLLRKITRFLED